eukprot:15485434-Alexandrium_andersonii.AAC.1
MSDPQDPPFTTQNVNLSLFGVVGASTCLASASASDEHGNDIDNSQAGASPNSNGVISRPHSKQHQAKPHASNSNTPQNITICATSIISSL